MGLAPYSTEVEHVHENRYRGVQDVNYYYLRRTQIRTLIRRLHSQNATKCYTKRRSPEVRLVPRIFFGPFFIRILTTFALWAVPNALIPTV